ncbi:peptidase inhibitor family I36 protein [Agromyces sp. MMS24-K17]|uniref:peptidase inhibitor family I36 protein n=1 Tax=Agromyces sp. MMS24-K17 TaxID=3372850 RepID=UPI0037541FFD
MYRTRSAAAALLAAALLLIPAEASTASTPSTDEVQNRINQVLAEFPGGVQTATNEVTWGNGELILTVADPSGAAAMSVGSCTTGAHCVYDGSNLAGSKLTFTSCTTQSVGPLGAPVRSIANARTSAVVRAYSDLGAVGSVSANSWINTTWAMTKIGC